MRRDKKKAGKELQRKQAAAAQTPQPSKQPRTAGASPVAEKQPRSLGIEHENARDRRPVWRFEYLDVDGPPSSHMLTVAEYKELHTKLASYESQTCKEIWDEQNGGKAYDVETAHENITKRLVEIERDDATRVHRLRLQGAYRVYGILQENVFHVLWLDHKHEMWPSEKKNT